MGYVRHDQLPIELISDPQKTAEATLITIAGRKDCDCQRIVVRIQGEGNFVVDKKDGTLVPPDGAPAWRLTPDAFKELRDTVEAHNAKFS